MNAVVAPAALVVRRTIAASAEELFDAWLDPQAMAIWMRPGEIRSTVAVVDARVGGRYDIVMKGDEQTYPHTGIYQVINRPRQLVFTWKSRGTGEKDSLVTVDFLPRGDATEVVITHERLPEDSISAHNKGWTSALERLDEATLAGQLP